MKRSSDGWITIPAMIYTRWIYTRGSCNPWDRRRRFWLRTFAGNWAINVWNFLEVERLRDCATCKPFDCGSSFLVSMISIPTNRYPKRLDIWKQLSKLFKSPWLPPPFRHSIPLHHVSSRVMFQSSATAVCNTERIVNFQPIQPRYK